MGLAAIPAAPSTAAAVSPPPARPSTSSLTTESNRQKSFYINKPVSDNDGAAAIVQRREIVPRAPLESHKLIFDTSDSRRALDDWELEDYVLVATIEGDLFALDRYSGATKWVLDGNGAAVQSRHHKNQVAEPTNSSNPHAEPIADKDQQPRWIVQPVEGGQLFLFDEEFGVLVTQPSNTSNNAGTSINNKTID
jgi:serine/threonine-protein kinase/endoribonuclease IRE1